MSGIPKPFKNYDYDGYVRELENYCKFDKILNLKSNGF